MLHTAVTSVLPMLQGEAEERMTERIVIDRVTGTEIDDEGREVNTYATIYDGIGRIRTYRPYEQTPNVGETTATLQRVDWHIPAPGRMDRLMTLNLVTAWSGPVQAGDRARRMTPGKPTKTVRVAGEHEATDQTAQRLVVDDITGGVWA